MTTMDADAEIQRMYESSTAFTGVPEWAASRGTAEPQSLYVDLASK
jgi:hypothetical protein